MSVKSYQLTVVLATRSEFNSTIIVTHEFLHLVRMCACFQTASTTAFSVLTMQTTKTDLCICASFPSVEREGASPHHVNPFCPSLQNHCLRKVNYHSC